MLSQIRSTNGKSPGDQWRGMVSVSNTGELKTTFGDQWHDIPSLK